MVSPSNLAYVLETVKDVGEGGRGQSGHQEGRVPAFNLINLHPFLDGNKRTAFEVAKNFLKLNGWYFEPGEDDAFAALVAVAKGSLDAESVEKWIGRNLSRKGAKA